MCPYLMIDKVEVISERGKGFGEKFRPIERELRANPRFGSFRPSKHYLAVGDLRPYGFDAIMHVEQRRYGTSKLELLDTGHKSLDQMCSTVGDLLDGDPLEHRVSRIDLCADVPGIPVAWFRDHVRVKRKQWIAEFSQQEVIEHQRMGKRKIQTLYWGKRPCCLRVYDKIAERQIAYARWCRKLIRTEKETWGQAQAVMKPEDREPLVLPELPSFQEWLSVELPVTQRKPPQSELPGLEQPEQLAFPVVTRVENQMGGSVPGALESLHLVKTNAKDFDPFAGLDLLVGRSCTPDLYAKDAGGKWIYTPLQYFAGMYLREHWSDQGAQVIWNDLNRDRNAGVYRELLRDFIPDFGPGVTPDELREIYRETVTHQLAA